MAAVAVAVPVSEMDPNSMESRVAPGLFLAGEILDVDGRLGGYNFQFAWSSGWVAGRGAARSAAGRATTLPPQLAEELVGSPRPGSPRLSPTGR